MYPPGEDDDPLQELLALVTEEDAPIAAARSRAGDDRGLPTRSEGALLEFTAAAIGARAAVEIGVAGGLSGLWLLRGMGPRGHLTTIEPDIRQRELAAQANANAGVDDRVRTIPGEPREVLGRLSDGGYDLVLAQAIPPNHGELLAHVRRVLRPGGVFVARNIAIGSPTELRARRALVEALSEDELASATVLALGGGVLLAALHTGED